LGAEPVSADSSGDVDSNATGTVPYWLPTGYNALRWFNKP